MKSFHLATVIATAFTLTLPAFAAAQSVSTTSSWERPYGVAPGQENRAWSGATASASAAARGASGNRVIVNGLIQTGVGVSAQLGAIGGGGVGSTSTAIGNQLNVNVSGRWNTVIVNSTQTNNGTVTATANGNVSTADDQE
ncbi:MAG: holdfast anchoring protein HfaA [Maricaulis sp.]|jgi:holdfast attachment protein HfaA|nr:holdfast anchoring protein HfaA [Maricaulis sp.]MDG2044196.1 holdfast anchoring protein HfaA [Maricaulis sp.]